MTRYCKGIHRGGSSLPPSSSVSLPTPMPIHCFSTMDNCRAGLYSFASTMTWLHETGMASPPLLVVFGLTLPDSRILTGISSIGLTLANIAIILPHLRQPILDSIHAFESALAGEQGKGEQLNSSPEWPDAMRPVILDMKSPVPASLSTSEAMHQSPPLTRCTTVESVCSTESLECQNVEPKVASQTPPLPLVTKVDDGQTSLHIHPSLCADSNETRVSFSCLFAREGRSAFHIPLPVPDVEEITFFDTADVTSSNNDLEEEFHVAACEQHAVIEDCGLADGKGTQQDDQPAVADPSSRRQRVEIAENSADVKMHVKAELASPSMNTMIQDHHSPGTEGIVELQHGLSNYWDAAHGAQTKGSSVSGKEAFTKRRPESLEFIPQSVLRRYPLVSTVLAGHCLTSRASSSGQEHLFPPIPPHLVANDPAVLLEGARPQVAYATLEGLWHASLFTENHPTRQSTGGPGFIVETVPVQGRLEQEPSLLPRRLAKHESTPLRQYSTGRHRLGVLARAALRDRKNDENDGSSTSDSDSDFDGDSQSSSGSSADENIFPHMLGADLIAAIDANSESDLNLATSRRTKRVPLNLYEEFLIYEDSSAEVSMVMQVSSNDDVSDGELTAPAFRSLTYEDIQHWAYGVVQKCVRQVCRSRVPAEPSSPSQASDVCAERPSGSGVSQCPLSGLHCKLGAATLTDISPPRTKEPPVSLPAPSIPHGRKPLQVRNLRDIPEFVPRQRPVSITARRVEGGTRSFDVARDAAAQVIARMENQAGFNARQWFIGTEKRMVNTAGGRQGMLRCA